MSRAVVEWVFPTRRQVFAEQAMSVIFQMLHSYKIHSLLSGTKCQVATGHVPILAGNLTEQMLLPESAIIWMTRVKPLDILMDGVGGG